MSQQVYSSLEVLLLMAVAAALLLWVLAARRLERRYDSLRDEVDALWRRIEWLCRDTDDRLSVNRLELQQKSKQVRNLWTRLRHVEEALYIEPSDAFKERKEDGEEGCGEGYRLGAERHGARGGQADR